MDAKPCRFASVFQIAVTLKLSPVETGMFRLQSGFKKTKLTLMLQTYSVEKRVRVCPPEADRAQSAYGGVLDRT